jgi:SAM-dependent methyltransferase
LFVDQNRRHYELGAVAERYATRSGLHASEAAILERHRREVAGRRILDLGVGGGRTTPYLLDLSSNYVGVDYSPEMIDRCRERFPGAAFEVVDARDLSRFSDASFDFALFSHSGIDAVEHEDRLKVLMEVHRVLSIEGLFVFSSHNRKYRIPKPWDPHHLALNPLRDPIRFGRRAASYPVGIMNYFRRAHRAEAREEYCISIDSAYRYSLLHYRIGAAAQKSQLERIGFGDIEVLDMAGSPLAWSEAETSDDNASFQYVCRRKEQRRRS